MDIKTTEEKIKEARALADRARGEADQIQEKEIKLERKKSPETIEKMRQSAIDRWKRERIGKLPPTYLSLEEALRLSKEEEALFFCQRYHIDLESKFEIFAIDWDGEWVMNYLERGLEETYIKMKQMLEWKQTQYVGIRTGGREMEDRKNISAIGKVEWKGKMAWDREIKYTVGLYTEYTGGLVKEFKEKGEEDTGRDISLRGY